MIRPPGTADSDGAPAAEPGLESDMTLLGRGQESHPAYGAFVEAMHGKAYGREAIRDAWAWFATGWTCCAADAKVANLPRVHDLRRLVSVLSLRLLGYAGDDVEVMPALEGDEGRVVMVHAVSCGGACDYACGAVSITFSGAGGDEDEHTIERVEYGAIVARGLGKDPP